MLVCKDSLDKRAELLFAFCKLREDPAMPTTVECRSSYRNLCTWRILCGTFTSNAIRQ